MHHFKSVFKTGSTTIFVLNFHSLSITTVKLQKKKNNN